jgi:hypothetical protein
MSLPLPSLMKTRAIARDGGDRGGEWMNSFLAIFVSIKIAFISWDSDFESCDDTRTLGLVIDCAVATLMMSGVIIVIDLLSRERRKTSSPLRRRRRVERLLEIVPKTAIRFERARGGRCRGRSLLVTNWFGLSTNEKRGGHGR